MSHDLSLPLDDDALVDMVKRNCLSRLAKESVECRLPGWFPTPRTPSNLCLSTPFLLTTLSVYKLSGQKAAEVQDVSLREPQSHISDHLRRQIFQSMAEFDLDFPIDATWLLNFLSFSRVTYEQSNLAMCTVVFPPIDINSSCGGWQNGFDYYEFLYGFSEKGEEEDSCSSIVVGRWSDSLTLLVGFYMSKSPEQHEALATCVSKHGSSFLQDTRYVANVKTILSHWRFTAVNSLKERYKGEEYDTTLWHLLLDNYKRWNYPGFVKIIQAMLARDDLDLSGYGWSWAKRETISASVLCFFEWCCFAGKSKNRQLWIDTSTPRLCLLSMCLHCPHTGLHASVEQLRRQLTGLLENDSLFLKKRAILKKRLSQDLKLLASEEIWPLPRYLKTEDLLSVEPFIRA